MYVSVAVVGSCFSSKLCEAASPDICCFSLCLNSKGSETTWKYLFRIEKFCTAHVAVY